MRARALATAVLASAASLLGDGSLDPGQLERFRQAEAAFDSGRYAEAAKGYAGLAGELPAVAELHAKLGLSQFFDRKCELSAPAFQRALEIRPDLSAGRVLLAICQSELGRYEEALAGLEKGYANPPDYPGVKRLAGLELVRSYLGLGQHAKAAGVTAELQVAHPRDPEVLFHANRTYREVAVQAAFELARVAPGSVWSHQAMGEAYESRQYYDLAAMEYRKALEADPLRPGLRFRLGEALLVQHESPGEADDALVQFELELAGNPNHASAALRAGEIHYARSNVSKAQEFLERAVHLRPRYAEAHQALGRALLDQGRVAESTRHLERAVEIRPDSAAFRYQLARAYREAGDRDAQREQLAHYRRLQEERRELDQRLLLEGPGGPRDPSVGDP